MGTRADGLRRGFEGWTFATAAITLVAVLGLALLLFVCGGITALFVPELLETGEPWVVSAAHAAGTGGTLYAPVDRLPFIHNNYNPLVQLIAAPILRLSGPAYWPLRAITFASALGLLLVVFVTVRRATGSLLAGFIAATLPLTAGFVFPWLTLGRVDVFATLATVAAATWVFAHAEATARTRALWLLFAWIAFASKQTMLAAPVAIVLDAARRGRWKEAIVQGAVFASGIVVIVVLANALSDGEYWKHAITYNAAHDRAAWWAGAPTATEIFWAFGPALILAGVIGGAAARREHAAWFLWAAVALVWAFFLVRKSGSHVHYFLETVVALSTSATIAAFAQLQAWRATGNRKGLVTHAFALLLIAAAVLPAVHRHHWQQVRHLHGLRTRADPVPRAIRERIRDARGPCLLTAKLGSLAIEEGKPAIFDIADFMRLQETGRWNPGTTLVPLVLAQAFPLIGIAEFPPGHPASADFDAGRIEGLMAAIEQRYTKLDLRVDDPKSRQSGSFWIPKEAR